MGVLVEDLLLLARLDQHPELRRAPVDLGALVVDVVESLAATAEGHDVRVEAAPGSDVVGDDEALRRVVANLVRNALLHTPDGTHVRVHVQRLVSSVRLDVVDDGQGMTPEVAAQVFERFYRPDSGRSRAVAGSGLGLAIVRSLVEAHGGSVRLQTAPGRGCAFTVELPTALRASDEPTPPGARVEPLVPALDG
jgi:two-component system OmpR family sensor kinase